MVDSMAFGCRKCAHDAAGRPGHMGLPQSAAADGRIEYVDSSVAAEHCHTVAVGRHIAVDTAADIAATRQIRLQAGARMSGDDSRSAFSGALAQLGVRSCAQSRGAVLVRSRAPVLQGARAAPPAPARTRTTRLE
eukprot:6204334-Pleurochrysis_carterae.AAC.2